MEDALVRNVVQGKAANDWVLILVLMEDALVQSWNLSFGVMTACLNPCFNGRCTRT